MSFFAAMKPQLILMPDEVAGDVRLVIGELEQIRFSKGDHETTLKAQVRYVFTKEELQRFLTSLVASISPPIQETQNCYDEFLKEHELL